MMPIVFEPCRLCGHKTAASAEEAGLVICDGCEDKAEVAALEEMTQ